MTTADNNNLNELEALVLEESSSERPNAEFVPFACYFNESTILTQNGELLQIIKIPSFMDSSGDSNLYTLRDTLQDTIIKNVRDDSISFWFQTVRKKANFLANDRPLANNFCNDIKKAWNDYNHWSNKYVNELYISIVIAPKSGTQKLVDFIKALSFAVLKRSKYKEFSTLCKTLTNTTNLLLKDLKPYGAQLLKVKEVNEVYYSEHLKFFSHIINLDDKDTLLQVNNIGESLIKNKIAYGKNVLQIYDKDGNSKYAAILSIKYCFGLVLSQLDKLIQMDQEMLITQITSFIDPKMATNLFYDDYDLLRLNEDERFNNLYGINDLVDPNTNDGFGYCITQTLIQVMGDTKEELEKNVANILKVLQELGLVTVREEMFMPTLFWSQLPANFSFVKRVSCISIYNIAQLMSLYNFPIGKMVNNKWGRNNVILQSVINTPYFFSYHSGDNGNVAIMGQRSYKKTPLLNFLVLFGIGQAKKIYHFDLTNKSKAFINVVGGRYFEITKYNTKNRFAINPFALPNTTENTEFLSNWLYNIIISNEDGFVKLGETATGLEQEWAKFKIVFQQNISTIGSFDDAFSLAKNNSLKQIANALGNWCKNGKYGFMFDTADTENIFSGDILGYNLSLLVNNEELKVAVVDYLLHMIMQKATGEPTIIAIDESWIVFDNKVMGAKFKDLLESFKKLNIVLLATTSGSDIFDESYLKMDMSSLFQTQFVLANPKATPYQRKVFGISDEEAKLLAVLKEEGGMFLLRHAGNVVVSSVNFEFLNKDYYAVFFSNPVIANCMLKAKEVANTEDPNVWTPLMFDILNNYIRVKTEAKLKEEENREIQWEESKQGAKNTNKKLLKA